MFPFRALLLLLTALAGCRGPAPAQGANVVLITLDTVRADHIGTYGYADARTPEIDALADESAVFETAISVAPITLPTHTTLFTGEYPFRHGVRNNGSFRLAEEAETLAERFRAAGYDTAAVVSAMVLDSKFGLDQGFRIYDDDLYAGEEQKLFMFKEVRAEVTIDKVLALLEGELREPFFLWVHLFDPHADYQPPPPYDVLFLEQPYDGEIAYVDKQLGRLFDALRSGGRDSRTVTVLTADHGDSLGDHGEQTHGIFIYRSTTHVPMMVRGPGIAPQRIEGLVSQVDVAPTLTELAGLEPLGEDGVSLVGTLARGKPVPSRPGVYIESLNPRMHFGWHELRAIDAGDEKYIDAPRPELYDLTDDPGEATNLYPGGDSEALAERLTEWAEGDDLDALRIEALDAETRDMLEQLGYVSELAEAPTGEALPDPKDVAHRWVDLQICHAMVRAQRDAEAGACLESVLESDPLNWAAAMSLAGILRRLGQPAKALEVLGKALERDPNNVKALISLAESYQALERFDDAIAALERACAASPTDPEPWEKLAELYQDRGEADAAVKAYGEALRRDEIYVDAYIGLANTFHRAGESERALRYLQEAVRLEPTNVAAWYNIGVVQDTLGRSGEAEKAYRQALEIDPHHAMSHNNLGSLLKRLGRKVEAEHHFRLALQADPQHVEAKYNLASLLIDDQPATSVLLFREVLAIQPDLVPARHNLAVALTRVDRPDEALEQYAWLVEHNPRAAGVYLAMASIEAGRGRTDEARRLVRKAVEVGGDEVARIVATDPALRGLGG